MTNDYRQLVSSSDWNLIKSKYKIDFYQKVLNHHPRFKYMDSFLKNNPDYRDEFKKMYKHTCSYCGVNLNFYNRDLFEVEHYIPRASKEDFIRDINNLKLSCPVCNKNKLDFILSQSIRDLLDPDIAPHNVFIRTSNFNICIKDEFKTNNEIINFFKALHLDFEFRRLDFIIMKIIALSSNPKLSDCVKLRLHELKDSLLLKRNVKL